MTDQDRAIARIERRLSDLERDGKGTAKTVADIRDTIRALAAVSARTAEAEGDTQLRLAKIEAELAVSR
jgi:hypothetical protein